MLRNSQVLLSIVLLITLCCQIIGVESENLPKILLESVKFKNKAELREISEQLSHVLVETQYSWSDQNAHKYGKIYLAIHGTDRNKKAAYSKLNDKYAKIAEKLTRQKIIPNSQALIHSIIHQRYLKQKKQWRFTKYFVIIFICENDEVAEAQQIIKKISKFNPDQIKPQNIQNKKIINYLNEKQLALQAFLEAKAELQNFIQENFDGKYMIVTTKDIQYQSQDFTNHDTLEEQIEEEDSDKRKMLYASQNEENLQQNLGMEEYGKQHNGRRKNIKIKVLFQIADKQFDIEEYFAQKEKNSQSEESISDYGSNQFESLEQL